MAGSTQNGMLFEEGWKSAYSMISGETFRWFSNINHADSSTFNRGFIAPLVKGPNGANHPGASYKGAFTHAGAMKIWNAAVRGHDVRRLTPAV
jgi:hypothetical protein